MAATAVGSDTDTIATMAGALIGAITDGNPEGPLNGRRADRVRG
jgi:hypothetical protein